MWSFGVRFFGCTCHDFTQQSAACSASSVETHMSLSWIMYYLHHHSLMVLCFMTRNQWLVLDAFYTRKINIPVWLSLLEWHLRYSSCLTNWNSSYISLYAWLFHLFHHISFLPIFPLRVFPAYFMHISCICLVRCNRFPLKVQISHI